MKNAPLRSFNSKIGPELTENVDSSTMIKSECTEEHVKMGHCKMDEASGISDQAAPSASENHHGN